MNPFKLVRTRLRLPQHGITGLSDSTVERIEAGHYESLSDGMIDALSRAVTDRGIDFEEISNDLNDRYGTPYIAEAYQRWRVQQRREFGDKVTWPDLDEIRRREGSPMRNFALEVSGSVNGFCRDLCIQAPTLERYMRGKYAYAEPPLALQEALQEAGYPERRRLFDLQGKWIDEQ